MRLTTRLKYGCLRLLGVVSPSGRYPLPPRWALSKLGRQRYYGSGRNDWASSLTVGPFPDRTPPTPLCASDCEAECCGPLTVSAGALPILTRPSACVGPCVGPCDVCTALQASGYPGATNGAQEGVQR